MFKFLNLINLDDPLIISHLKSHGFSDNDDIMRLLDVDTTELADHEKSIINLIKQKSKSDPSDNVPRIFLEQIMDFFEHKKNKFESIQTMDKDFKAEIAQLRDQNHHLKQRRIELLDDNLNTKHELNEKTLELDKCTLELEKTKQQAKTYVAALMKNHQTRLAEKDAEYNKQIAELKKLNQNLERLLRSRASKEDPGYDTEFDETAACMANPYFIPHPQQHA
jgi:chromosome segregation ATPase